MRIHLFLVSGLVKTWWTGVEREWKSQTSESAASVRFAARGGRWLNGSTTFPESWTKSLRMDLATTFVAGVGGCAACGQVSGCDLSWGLAGGAADFALGSVFRSDAVDDEARAWARIAGGPASLGLLAIGPAFAEELLFRGPLVALSHHTHDATALGAAAVISVLCFAAVHSVDDAERDDAHTALRAWSSAKSALVCAGLALATGDLGPPIAAHAAHNALVCMAIVFGEKQEERRAYTATKNDY